MSGKKPAKTKPREPTPADESAENSHAPCVFETCRRNSEPVSGFCIYHMPAGQKDEHGLWEECMQSFEKKLVIGEGDFCGFVLREVSLAGKAYEHNLDFSKARFIGPAVLSGPGEERAQFKGELNLSQAVFEGPVGLSWAGFAGFCDFSGAEFRGRLDLRWARFAAPCNFKNLSCAAKADFSESVFKERASFQGSTFKVDANFAGVCFEKGASFDLASFATGDFGDAAIQNVSFRQVCLDKVKFAGAQMENAYLADSWWTAAADRSKLRRLADGLAVYDPRFVIREEEEANLVAAEKPADKVKALRRAESTYRRLKHTHTNEGDYAKAGEFYIHEMRMKRCRYSHQTGFKAKWKYLWNLFYSISCGYGERPRRVIANALLVIIAFALLYNGLEGIHKGVDPEYDLNYDPTFKESFYFSVVTFTTLGYGDYAPKPEAQLLATVEAFTGGFTMALFVLVFARKVMR